MCDYYPYQLQVIWSIFKLESVIVGVALFTKMSLEQKM